MPRPNGDSRPAWMPRHLCRHQQFPGFCGKPPKRFTLAKPAQGIEAVSFFACGKKDTSAKPGPATQVAGCAQILKKFRNV
jgi:hypothetical protein